MINRLKSSLEEALASNREQASDIANLQDELRRIHSSVQVITYVQKCMQWRKWPKIASQLAIQIG